MTLWPCGVSDKAVQKLESMKNSMERIATRLSEGLPMGQPAAVCRVLSATRTRPKMERGETKTNWQKEKVQALRGKCAEELT